MFSILAAVLFFVIAILNLLLLFGLPLGELTMGGQYKVLPKQMKIPAALSLIVQVFAMIVVLQAGGYISLWFSFGVTRIICYIYAGYLVLNACMCIISKSKKEKYIMTPLALCAAVCFFVTAFQMETTVIGGEPTFNGSRTSNENQFLMEYSIMNMTESSDFELEVGDVIEAEVVSDSGELAVMIQKGEETPIFQEEQLATSSFHIEIVEKGTYTITVSGNNAKGSVSFRKR